MINRMYQIIIDSKFDTRLKEFMEQLNEYEEIISQQTIKAPDGTSKLLITTKESKPKAEKNLLLDQINRGEMPNVFGITKDKK